MCVEEEGREGAGAAAGVGVAKRPVSEEERRWRERAAV